MKLPSNTTYKQRWARMYSFRISVQRTCTEQSFWYGVRSMKHPSKILYGFQLNGTSILVRSLIYRTTKCIQKNRSETLFWTELLNEN